MRALRASARFSGRHGMMHPVKIWHMAGRHVLRSKRRSLITILAMAFALGVMVVYMGLMDGLLRDMEQNAVMLEMGHLQIHAPGYLDTKSIYTRIGASERIMAALAGFSSSPRLFASGLAAKGDASVGIVLRGVDPVREAATIRLPRHLLTGRWLDQDDPHGAVLGKRLAHALAARVGDTIVVVSQAADGSLANDLFTVRGILKAASDGIDRSGFFITNAAFRALMVVPEGVHEIVVTIPPHADLVTAASRVKMLCPGLDVRTWQRLNPPLADMIASTNVFLIPLIVITYIAIAIVILNAMLMAVFERIHEYGIMKALGVGPLDVFRLVLAEMAIMAATAGALGLAGGVPLAKRLETHGIDLADFIQGGTLAGVALDPVWRALLTPRAVWMPLAGLVIFALLAGLYPAAKAARLNPVDAIHHVG